MRTSVIEVRDLLSVLTVDEVEKRIRNVPGGASATVNYAARSATVRYDETRLEVADIKVIVHQRGLQSADEALPKHKSEHEPVHKQAVAPPPRAAAASTSTPALPALPALPAVPVVPVVSVVPVVPGVPATGAPALDDPTGHSASDPPPPHPPAMAKAGSLDDPSVKDADEVARALGVDIESGLTSEEASRRLLADGPNELRSAPRRPAWRRVLAHFQDPLVYLLLAAVAIALVAWGVEGWVG